MFQNFENSKYLRVSDSLTVRCSWRMVIQAIRGCVDWPMTWSYWGTIDLAVRLFGFAVVMCVTAWAPYVSGILWLSFVLWSFLCF